MILCVCRKTKTLSKYDLRPKKEWKCISTTCTSGYLQHEPTLIQDLYFKAVETIFLLTTKELILYIIYEKNAALRPFKSGAAGGNRQCGLLTKRANIHLHDFKQFK